jgi:hypothetical protein
METNEINEEHINENLNTEQNQWLNNELDGLSQNNNFERLESLKLEENKIETFEVLWAEAPFEKYEDKERGTVKKIIPVIHNGTKKNWWLNTRNPTYKEILQLGLAKQNIVKIMRTGKENNTKYIIVK